MRHLGPCSIAAMLAAAIFAPNAHAAGARLTPSAGAAFPARSYVLTLPAGVAPGADTVQVRENGKPVSGLRVKPADARFAVMLVIDASSSMRGRPIRGAMVAARAFAAQRPASQALGVVIFNGSVDIALAPTTNAAAIDQVLARTPRVQPRTRIFDATAAALREITGRFEAGAVVVLSDGRDIGSATTSAQIAAGAVRHHARLFTVGLRSDSFDASTLQAVATAGRGEYLGAVTTRQLSGVYRRLGGELTSIYLLRYRSLAAARERVTVTASTASLQARDSYRAPRLRVAGEATGVPSPPQADDAFPGTTAGAALVGAAVGLLILVGVIPALRRHQRIATLRRRVGDYGVDGGRVGAMSAAVDPSDHPERSRRSGEWRAELERDLDLAAIAVTPAQAIVRVGLVAIGLALLLTAALGSPLMFALVLIGTPIAGRAYLKRRVAGRRAQFAEQLAGTVQAVASAMRSGASFVGALTQVIEDSPEPTASEFRRIIADERLGVPLERALQSGVERMDSRDLHQIALVAVIQRETGGNASEALDRVVQNIRSRDDLRRLLRTLTAQGRLAMRVLVGLPFAALGGLTLLSPDEMRPLYTTATGHTVLFIAACMIAGGAVWVRKIVTISM